jgi:cytochrome bd-type quinol oxidase subunit 1
MVLISIIPMIFTGLFLFISTRVKDSAEISVFIALIGGLLTSRWIAVFNVPPQEDEKYD